ncbi:MAG: hypothetical protein M3220_20550, partial [Chloroflexota bacterium]|nr:hypothetical protein [Chloroflexota bacterium]
QAIEYWCWMAQRALVVLKEREQGRTDEYSYRRMKELREAATHHHKWIQASMLLPLAEYVIGEVEGVRGK